MRDEATFDVIVLGYGAEPHLVQCLRAIRADSDPETRLILVDNGVPGLAALRSALPSGLSIVGRGENLGFADGCNVGASTSSGDVLVFVNSDAIVTRGSLRALVRVASEDGVGLAAGCLRLADRPHLINSAGNPIHFTGITWAGCLGEDATRHAARRPVASASGGFFAVRRDVWNRLHGFDPVYFAYHEDVDLSLRAWMSGASVELVPEATALHYYEFSRNPTKMFLLERNRLITVLCDYPRPVLAAVLPVLVALEAPLLALAATQGWLSQAVSARWWVVRHPLLLARRRAAVQAELTTTSSYLATQLSGRIEPPMVASPPPGMGMLNNALERYWRWALTTISRRDRESSA